MRDREERKGQLVENPRHSELQLDYAVLSLRVWLAGLARNDRQTRSAYLAWRAGSGWMAPSAFDKNGRAGTPRSRAGLRRRTHASAAPAATRSPTRPRWPAAVKTEFAELWVAGAVHQPEPVPFSEALRAVMEVPHLEATM